MAEPLIRSEADRLEELLLQRQEVSSAADAVLTRMAGETSLPGVEVPSIRLRSTDRVAVRVHKEGVFYSLTYNRQPLPFNETGVYPLSLSPGTNGLGWLVFKAKDRWAYQVELVVNNNVVVLDRRSHTDGSSLPQIGQRALIVEA